jgi:hypothetical protein
VDSSVLTLDRPAEGSGVPAAGRESDPPQWEVVVPDATEGLWPIVGPMIQRAREWSAVSQKMESIEDIRQRLASGHYALWVCLLDGKIIAVLVLRMMQHARCKALDIHYGAGEHMLKWLRLFHDKVVADARAMGCRFVRITGRGKWKAALKRIGFEETATIFTLEI